MFVIANKPKIEQAKTGLIKDKGECLACHHSVHIPLGGMHPFAQLGQDTAQAVGGHAPHDRRMGGFHALEQLGGGKGQHFLRMVLFGGKTEAEAEYFLFGYVLVEQRVVLLHGLFLFLVEPASLTGQKLRLELGVQLLVLYGRGAVYGVFQTDTEKTS